MRHEFAIALDDIKRFDKPIEFSLSRGPKWLRMAANRHIHWLLRLFCAKSWGERHFRRFAAPRSDDLLTRLRMQQDDMDRLYNQRAKTLLVGPKEFDDVQLMLRGRAMSLGELDFRLGGPRGIKVLGIEVVVIPWMDGYLLLPDLSK